MKTKQLTQSGHRVRPLALTEGLNNAELLEVLEYAVGKRSFLSSKITYQKLASELAQRV